MGFTREQQLFFCAFAATPSRGCLLWHSRWPISFPRLVRAITATLSPTLTVEFGLSAQDLGLLAGGYFLGFSLTQLPLGRWLDRYGPKKVILAFLSIAVAGCLAFAWADTFMACWLHVCCVAWA
jgi:MFS family permease